VNKKTTVGVVMFAFIVLSIGAFAYQGINGQKNFQNIDEDVRNQMQEALSNNDYAEWIRIKEETSVSSGRVSEVITEENFQIFNEMHEAKLAGDFDKVWELKEQLGIGRMGKGSGKGMGRMR
jgi:hypothetical protein